MKHFVTYACASATAVAAAALVSARASARAQDAPPATPPTASASTSPTAASLCHGRAGQGGAYNGPAPALAKTELPFDGFKVSCATRPTTCRPIRTAVLSDQEVADIYAFLQSLPGATSAKDIAILND